MNEHQRLAIRAIEQLKGDDTIRARMAFHGMTPEQMQGPHGNSGKSRNSILAEYEEFDARADAAIAWVKAQC